MMSAVPGSLILLLVFCWLAQKRMSAYFSGQNLTREALFADVSSYVCLALAAVLWVARI